VSQSVLSSGTRAGRLATGLDGVGGGLRATGCAADAGLPAAAAPASSRAVSAAGAAAGTATGRATLR